jgi:hypothetical protein
MSKSKRNRNKGQAEKRPSHDQQTGRRKFITAGLGGLGALAVTGLAGYKAGWFESPEPAAVNSGTGNRLPAAIYAADHANAVRAADELIMHYTRELKTPYTIIHAIRAFGRNFTLADGTSGVDYLCSKFASTMDVNGKRYLRFTREAEVHDNSFLKTMLEAEVSLDQPITAGGARYALRDLGEGAKALFRCDPQNLKRYDDHLVEQHLPWGLIAFSILVPPSQSTWTNAYGDTINLPAVIDRGLADFEGVCKDVKDTIARGEMESLEFRQDIAKYSCYGMHLVYGYLSCLKNGYRNNNLAARLNAMMDSVIYRLKGDALAIDREADAVRGMGPEWIGRIAVEGEGGKIVTRGAPPPNTIEVMRLRSQIKMLGHAFEALNFCAKHNLFTLSPEQKNRMAEGEQLLYGFLVKLRSTDLSPFIRWHSKFVGELVIALSHASRALKLLTPDNPDVIARMGGDGSVSA